jgi:hypothetical protein
MMAGALVAPTIPLSPMAAAPATRQRANQRFQSLVQGKESLRLSRRASWLPIVHQSLSLGGGAGFAFGLGRSMGAAVVDLVGQAIETDKEPQWLGVGRDTLDFHEMSKHELAMTYGLPLVRWGFTAIGGGMGAAAGHVLAGRLANWAAGVSLQSINAHELVPDHVAHLKDPQGQLYGEAGVAALRREIQSRQKAAASIDGPRHINGGRASFGLLNAARGLGQGMQPMGALVNVAVSTAVSGLAGAATGAQGPFTCRDCGCSCRIPRMRIRRCLHRWWKHRFSRSAPPHPLPIASQRRPLHARRGTWGPASCIGSTGWPVPPRPSGC